MEIKPRDIVMDTVLAFLVGVQIYMILDEVTDGNFSRELSVRTIKFRAKLKELIRIEQHVQRDTGKVIWDAINIVDGDGIDDDGDTTDNVNPFNKS